MVGSSVLSGVRCSTPSIVRADGTHGGQRERNPSGGIGVVTMPGIPLAAAIGR